MHRVAPREHEQRSRRHRQHRERIAVAGEHAGDVVVALVVGGADERRDLEVAALVGVLQRERHDEVGLVEVPLQLVAVAHHREVERAERVGVGIDRVEPEDRGDERPQLLPLEQLPDRRVGREEVVRDRADAVVPEPLARVIGRERSRRGSRDTPCRARRCGARAARAAGRRRRTRRAPRGGRSRGARRRPDRLHLRAAVLDRRPVEIDDRVQIERRARPECTQPAAPVSWGA